MLHQIKRLVPLSWIDAYHYLLARLAAFWYGHPSRHLIVIGVTGTNGKTTTSYLLAKALEASGFRTGCTTTAIIKIGECEWLNATKMTMPGRFFLQRMLRRMVDAGCRYAVIETSSQGLIQHRHIGIEYDAAIFTNLTPEHIEAHGGFEPYKRAKKILFDYLASLPAKTVGNVAVKKTAIVNADDPHAEFFARTPGIERVIRYGLNLKDGFHPDELVLDLHGSHFSLRGIQIKLKLPGRYNVSNALAVFAACEALGVDLEAVAKTIGAIEHVPGRFEFVEAGQPWKALIDYAPEPESLRNLYAAIDLIPHKRLIHVLGSCGGGRDASRRPIMGEMAGTKADIVIVTNEDPYDDDPVQIIHQVAEGAVQAGKKTGKTLFCIEDRAQAIEKAMALAEADDLVLMTGKGCEPWICGPKGTKIPWNEHEKAEEAIRRARIS